MTVPEVFGRITAALESAGIEYMLSGSFASAGYSSPRSTQDIDLVISATPAQLTSFVENLRGQDYYAELHAAIEAHRHESLFNVIDLKTGWKIDLIPLKSRAFSQEEFGRRCKIRLHGLDLVVASPEDIIIAKLEWAKLGHSQRQIEDAASVLRVQGKALDKAYLEKWISELQLNEQWDLARRAAGRHDATDLL